MLALAACGGSGGGSKQGAAAAPLDPAKTYDVLLETNHGTFTIRLAMLPLTIRQFRSMAAMQNIQPKVKALQNRYKGKSDRESKQDGHSCIV